MIDPAGFSNRPQQPLFALALPSPAFVASRLDAQRPTLRVGSTRMDLVIPGTTFVDTAQAAPPPEMPPPPTDGDAPPAAGPPPDPGAAGPPVYYPYPYPPPYTGVVIIDPQDRPSYGGRNPNNAPIGRPVTPANTGSTTTTADPPRTSRPVPVATTPHDPPRELPHPVMAPMRPFFPAPPRAGSAQTRKLSRASPAHLRSAR